MAAPKGKSKTDLSTDAKSNFGSKGWLMVVFVGVMLYLQNGTSSDGPNIVIPYMAEVHGWDQAALLNVGTISGLISIAAMFLFGIFCDKKGARLTALISLIIGGLAYIWYGNVQSVTQYAISYTLIMITCNVYAWIAGGAYLSSWFPRKKGLALGWATMGNNLSSATFVIILSFISAKASMGVATAIIGVFMLLVAVWSLFMKNNPEEAGATPDNVPMSPDEMEAYRQESNSYVSPWTYSRLVRTKEFWLISIGLGLYMLVTVGIMSQLVPRMTSLGLTQEEALGTMSICAVVGVVGSYLWGVLDQKLTTRIATAIYGVWYAVAIIFNLIPNRTCLYISVFMIGIAIGGNANWPVSLVSTVYGHRNFAKIYSLVNPCISIIRVCCFSVLAASIALTGSLAGAYGVFVVLAFLAAGLILLINDKKYAED